jgi:hypothetical protein
MKTHTYTLSLLLSLSSTQLFAQSLPSIQLDRPDQTECPFITPTKYIQAEHGFTAENFTNNQTIYSYPSTLWKYGVNQKLELRLITELVSEKNSGAYTSGLMPITLGFKTALLEEKGVVPKTSFIGHITTAGIGSQHFSTSFIAPSFRFTMQHTLSNTVSLAYNIGAEWDGETAAHTYIYTLTTGIAVTNKLGGYAELYGFAPAHAAQDHRCDGGFTYLINPNIIADISAGIGITSNAPKQYVSLGFSYRFSTVKR